MPHPDTSRRLFPLTACSIGLWTPSEGMRPFLLLCPDRKQFVVLLAREPGTKAHNSSGGSLSVNAVLACARNYAALWLRHKNPFIDHTQEPSGDTAVLTFEVAFADVVGMDFRWPLTDEPRLVLEASCLCKRVFHSVDEVCAYFPPVLRQRRLRALGATSGAAPAAGAAAAADASQQLHDKQQQPQQAGSGAADTVGVMSRVPSWASWASWTIGSARPSIDLLAAQPAQPAAAAAGPAAAAHATTTAGETEPAAAAGSSSAQVAGGQSAGGAVLEALSEHGQQSQQRQTTHEQCLGHRSDSGSSSGSGNSGSSRGPGCTLDSMVSLNVGMAGSAAQAAAAAVAVTDASLAGESCSSPNHQQQQQQQPQPWSPRRGRHSSDHGPSNSSNSTAAAAAGSAGLALLLPGSRQHTPGTSPVPSGASTPALPAGALSDSSVLSEHAALLQGALAEASFGFWQRPEQQERLLRERLNGPEQRQMHFAAGPRHLRLARHGAATVPCSMPNSPRQGDMSFQVSSPTAASDAGGSGALSRFEQQLMHHQQQPQQRASQQQQQDQQLCQHGSRAAGGVSGSRRSSRSRLASSVDSACPLCHQALTQPHAVLQQRFHQQLEHKHARFAAAAATGQGLDISKGGVACSGVVTRSRSACSLQQLQQLQQQERDNSDGGGSSSRVLPKLNMQQQRASSDQHEQPSLSPRSFAGLAAAAIGVLAARCKPSSVPGSSRGGQWLLGLQRADTGASEICTPDAATAAAAAVAAAAAAAAADRGSNGGLSTVDDAGTLPLLQQQSVDAPAVHSSSSTSAAAAAAPVKGGAAGLPDTSTATATPASAAAHDTAAHASLGDKAPAAPAAEAGTGPAPAAGMAADAGAAAALAAADTQGPGSSSSMYSNRTIVLTFTDPTLPYQLSKLVKTPSNVHLLKLYESGLPAWAVVLPSYGLWYRPWLRRVTWLLFVLLSVVSMAMGFYDLWKNVPYFKQFVVGMFRPAAAVFEWLEGHTQIRLSILLTYMLGKSQLLVQLIKLLTDASLQPLLAPFAPLLSVGSSLFNGVVWLLQPYVEAVRLVFGPIGRLAWVVLQLLWRLVSTLLWFGPLQLLQALGSAVVGVGQLLLLPFEAVLPAAASLRAGWGAAKATGQVARNAVPVVAEAARTAAGAGTWWWWSPFEAFELMRVSTVRVVKVLQAVLRFLVTLASTINKHRLSLMVQLKGKVWGGLQAAAASPAGRVATVVAQRMGQGDRLRRVQHTVARKLHAQDSLNSMGSEALTSMGPFSPAAADGCPFRPYSRTFSMDGDSDGMLLETPERGSNSEEDDSAGEVSSNVRWQQQVQVPGHSFRSSNSTGLRQRAVTAAAAAAAAAASAAASGEGSITGVGPVTHGSVLLHRHSFQQLPQGDAVGMGAAGVLYAPGLMTAGYEDPLLAQQQQQRLPQTGMLAASGRGDFALVSSSRQQQDPVLAAAAARAAFASSSYQMPDGSLRSRAAVAAGGSGPNLQQLGGLRQSSESFMSGRAARGFSAGREAPGLGPVLWQGAGVQGAGTSLQRAAAQAAVSEGGAVNCSGAALLTEAAGLLMLPSRQLHQPGVAVGVPQPLF